MVPGCTEAVFDESAATDPRIGRWDFPRKARALAEPRLADERRPSELSIRQVVQSIIGGIE